MNEFNNEISNLNQYTKRLYFRAGQFNLSVCGCYNKNNPDIKRLKLETERIKKLILNIENEIDALQS